MQSKNLNYEKYLKYKNKYLNLMNQIGGGPIDDSIGINVCHTDSIINKNIIKFNNVRI